MTVWRPVPTDFWEAPYCATLFVIDYALEVLTCALAAEHPGVLDIVPPEDLDLPVADLLAIKIAITSEQLRRLLDAYREAVAPGDRFTDVNGKPRPR
jgi:hypothetical protein